MTSDPGRPYTSSLRQLQTDATRRLIVDSGIALLTENPSHQVSHEAIGARADMAPRTVYRYFPSRAELLDAMWEELDQRLGLSELPETAIELMVLIPELFRRLDAQAPVVEALITSTTGHEMSRRTDERRLKSIERALLTATAHLSRRDRDRLVALVRVLTSPMTWYVLRQKTRVTGDQPAEAVDWALRTLISAASGA